MHTETLGNIAVVDKRVVHLEPETGMAKGVVLETEFNRCIRQRTREEIKKNVVTSAAIQLVAMWPSEERNALQKRARLERNSRSLIPPLLQKVFLNLFQLSKN